MAGWKMFPWSQNATSPHFTFHPLAHALSSALSGTVAAVDKTNPFMALQGKPAPAQATLATTKPDANLELLQGLGIHPTDAQSILDSANRSSQIAKLPKELQQPATDYFTTQQQKSQQQPFMDPMMMQMFFANTIAPYMQQFSQGTTKQIQGMYDDELKNLPSDPMTHSLMQSLIPQEKAAAVGESNANQNALGPASAITTLMQQLQASQQAQLQYAADIRNNLAQNALGTLLGGSSPFAAPTK